MDAFTRAYIAAALWSSVDDDGDPLDSRYDESDIAPETLAYMVEDCARFQRENDSLLTAAASSGKYGMPRGSVDTRGIGWHSADDLAGHDFWLTRCEHGVGFWDRGLGDIGEQLTAAAKAFGNMDLYVADDGKIWA